MSNFDDWPLYFKDRLILSNPDSEVGVVTLWTPKEAVIGKLSPNEFCLLGQLYTKRGINYILRNVLAHPSIRQILITGSDLAGSGEALLALSTNGVEEINGRRQIKGVENAYIDSEISIEAIAAFRENVQVDVIDCGGPQGASLRIRREGLYASPQLWRNSEVFSEPKVTQTQTFPSEQTVFTVRRVLVGEAWVEILKHVLRFGTVAPTIYGGTKKELLNVTVVIDQEDPADFKVPDYLNLSKNDVNNYINKVFAPELGEEPYTYGERLLAYNPIDKFPRPRKFVNGEFPSLPVNQIDLMVEKLTRYPEDVGALAVLWQPEVDNFPVRTPWRTPCLTLIQGVCHGDLFYLTAYFRSNDMFGAWPLNCFALCHLQNQLADRIGKKSGPLTTISHCAHIYDNALAEASRVVSENDKLACRTDLRGNFVIEAVGQEIMVKHLSPNGLVLNEYRQDATVNNAAQKLANRLVQELSLSDLSHALDLGAQLARAEESIRHHLKFTQDRPLS